MFPPKGVSPIHWRLLTSHDVSSFDQARWIIRLYRRRWIIEQFFLTIKTQGFDIERVLMSTAPFRNLCAMTLVAGVSCLQLVQDRNGECQRPLEDVFSPADREALEAVSVTLEGPDGKAEEPASGGIPGLFVLGLCTSRGMELLLWKTGLGCHVAWAVSIQGHKTWI